MIANQVTVLELKYLSIAIVHRYTTKIGLGINKLIETGASDSTALSM